MAARTISVCKFVGTISLGILTGVSATLSTMALPALLALPTAPSANESLSYLTRKSQNLTFYLRQISSMALFSAYLLAPRRLRHPYLLYTSILAFMSGSGVDLAVGFVTGKDEDKAKEEGKEGDAGKTEEVNGEQVRTAVERKQSIERAKAGLAGLAFAMQVIGIWGDGA